jgi:hypothetical protein
MHHFDAEQNLDSPLSEKADPGLDQHQGDADPQPRI